MKAMLPMARRTRTLWTDARVDRLCTLLRGGATIETAATALGLTRGGLAAQIGKMKARGDTRLPELKRGRRDGKRTPAERLRRHASVDGRRAPLVLPEHHRAVVSAEPLFAGRVTDPADARRALISGVNSRKIGGKVTKGARRGWPIFTLTLPERTTCPASCSEWRSCYGNGSNWAVRLMPGDALEKKIWDELAALQARHPRGFLVRLHILGDFHSVAYVDFWRRALAEFPALHAFGFTARLPGADPIGAAVEALSTAQWDRFVIRVSGRRSPEKSSIVSDLADDPNESLGIVCPAQTGASLCCATCALCFTPGFTRSIVFRRH